MGEIEENKKSKSQTTRMNGKEATEVKIEVIINSVNGRGANRTMKNKKATAEKGGKVNKRFDRRRKRCGEGTPPEPICRWQ